jgi:hypothetical protein
MSRLKALFETSLSKVEQNHTHQPADVSITWADEDTSAFVLAKSDERSREDDRHILTIHLPIDDVLLSVRERQADTLTVAEASIAQVWLHSFSDVPWHSFAAITYVQLSELEHLRNVGEFGEPNSHRKFHQLALRVNEFRKLQKSLTTTKDTNGCAILCYFVPAFLFNTSALDVLGKLQESSRSYLKQKEIVLYQPNTNHDPRQTGWRASHTSTILQMAGKFLDDNGVDQKRLPPSLKELFDRAEAEADRQLERHLTVRKEIGRSRIIEILSNPQARQALQGHSLDQIQNILTELSLGNDVRKFMPNSDDSQTQQSHQVPSWWPSRLLDVILNAILPGPNTYYFRDTYNTLSYVWENDGLFRESQIPWFSNQSVKTLQPDAYDSFRKCAAQVDVSELFWVDALCIDQGNMKEVRREIARAADYYSHCEKALIMPSGISKVCNVDDLLSANLPRWFERAWTLQEAALSPFMIFKFGDLYLDRFETVERLHQNKAAPSLLLDSSRHVLRRESFSQLGDLDVLRWVLGRDCQNEQDLIHGNKGLFQSSYRLQVSYNVPLRDVLLDLIRHFSPFDQTATSVLTSNSSPHNEGPTWLPGRLRPGYENFKDLGVEVSEIGPVTTSYVRSHLGADYELEMTDVPLIAVASFTEIEKPWELTSSWSRALGVKVSAIEKLSYESSTRSEDHDSPCDNAVVRAWVAVTYLTSNSIKMVLRDTNQQLLGRNLFLQHIKKPSHVAWVGKLEKGLFCENVYLCLEAVGDKFKKVGVVVSLDLSDRMEAEWPVQCIRMI